MDYSASMPPGIAAFLAEPAFIGFNHADLAQPFAGLLHPEDTARAAEYAARYHRPLATDLLTPFEGIAAELSKPGYLQTETGWGILPNGAATVAVLTPMPNVAAHMWDWWFSWHSAASARYKIWAPAEHLVALWKDGEGEHPGEKSYIGRTSLIKEHIGSVLLEGAIRFVEPASIGFLPEAFDGTVICGRAGEVLAPVEHTWLIHQLRNTETGCEMRSRFFLGQDPQFTHNGAPLPPPDPAVQRPGPVPAELLVHCATEMHHLAGILRQLYEMYH